MKTYVLVGQDSKNRVVLLAPEEDDDFFHLGARKGRIITEKLGLIHLASYLTSFGWKFEQVIGIEASDVGSYCRGTYVGISSHINNYDNALTLATVAKENGAKAVVMGGPHPTNRAEQIIRNRPDVDYVVRGQGEEAFRLIIEDKVPRGVVEEIHLPLNELPVRNRPLWPIDSNAEMFGRQMSIISLSEGCPQAMCGNACVFCSIYHAKTYSRRTVEQVATELEQLQAMGYGALEITDDDFPRSFGKENLRLLAEIIEKRALQFDIYIHAGVRSCDADTIALLKRIGVQVIQTGFETNDPAIKLAHANKATIMEEDIFIEECKKRRIRIHISNVFGMPGETASSMEHTFRRIEDISRQWKPWAIQADPIIPLPGSRAFEMLCNKCPEFVDVDRLDVRKMIEVWFANFTAITLDAFIQRREQMLETVNPDSIGGFLMKIMQKR